jgi:formamidopyrimidine-DNA glycosylase
MPELPEVEVVRRGLEPALVGRRIGVVEVLHPRAVRRHLGGPHDFGRRLDGLVVDGVRRRGKYLWLPLRNDTGPDAGPAGAGSVCLVGHLGMSGQLLIQPASAPISAHLRVRVRFRDDGPELRFVDQRTFGGLMLDELVPTGAETETDTVPAQVAHIARDPIDPGFDQAAWIRRARRSDSAIKRTLLDQTLISGVGNIYADEALWRAGLHGQRRASSVAPVHWRAVAAAIQSVLTEALAQGGTSFDALYVNVNGESGYFSRALNVYGREGEPCRRCGTPIRRSPFMNRSSYWCPRCQPAPRSRRAG